MSSQRPGYGLVCGTTSQAWQRFKRFRVALGLGGRVWRQRCGARAGDPSTTLPALGFDARLEIQA